MLTDAQKFWDSISGKVKELCRRETSNTFRCERYDVTTVPDGSVIGVHRPFGGTELFLPYSAEVENAAVGDSVLVVWWGSMSNAKVYYFGNGYMGASGGGLPSGGSQGQALIKQSSSAGDADWETVGFLPAGGSAGDLLVKLSGTSYNAGWDAMESIGAVQTGTITQLAGGGTFSQSCYKLRGTVNAFARFYGGSAPASGNFFELPAGFRPRAASYGMGAINVGTTWIPLYFTIGTDGKVGFSYSSGQTANQAFFTATFPV